MSKIRIISPLVLGFLIGGTASYLQLRASRVEPGPSPVVPLVSGHDVPDDPPPAPPGPGEEVEVPTPNGEGNGKVVGTDPMPPDDPVKTDIPDDPPKPDDPPTPPEERTILTEFRLGETERKEVGVEAVTFVKQGDELVGGTMPLTVRVEGNSSGEARFSLRTGNITETGEVWKASAWLAAFVASQSLGQPITDHEFGVGSSGDIDGPSAGMLISAAMAALMTGDEIVPLTTITGTVNPDGTCGPVDGLIQKLEGAKKKGLSRFGYPARNRSIASGTDLRERAGALDMEVKEIANLMDAYEFLTGKPHPGSRVEGVAGGGLPPIETALMNRLKGARAEVATRVKEANEELRKKAKAALEPAKYEVYERGIAERLAKLKEHDLAEQYGAILLSYYRTIGDLLGNTTVAELLFGVNLAGKDDGYASAWKYLQEQAEGVEKKRASLAGEMLAPLGTPELSGRIDALNLTAMLQEVAVYRESGEHKLARARELIFTDDQRRREVESKEENEEIKHLIRQAVYAIALAKTRLVTAESWPAIVRTGGGGGDEMAAAERAFFDQVGKSYASGAESSLKWLKSVKWDDWEKHSKQQFGRGFEKAPYLLYEIEPLYDRTRVAVDRTLEWQRRAPPDERDLETVVNVFGSGVFAYLEVSKMILSWYSFPGVSRGAVENQHDTEAFSQFVDEAREAALAKALRLQSKKILGRVPDSVLLNLHLGDQLRHGNSAENWASLVAFWKSSLYSDLALSAYKNSVRTDAEPTN